MNAMVGGDEEQLAINVIAKLTDLEKQMAKANGITARAFREMTLTTKKATRQMEDDAARSATRINQAFATVGTKIGGVGKAFAAGGIAGLVGGGIAASLAGLVNQAREAADSIAEIGTAAKMAGLPVKEFQEWAYVAEQTRIPLDAITDGLKELSLRADEFAVTGKGSAAEAFQRIGMSPEEVQQRLKDPSALLLEIVDRVRQLGDTAAGVRIFDELFGGQGGERMVALLDQGSDGINRMIDDAHDFGRVLDDEMIAKAQQIDAEFNRIANTVGITLKSAIVSAVASLSDFLDGLRAVENQRTATIQARQKSVMAEKADVARRIGEIEA
ncbi:phage tail tape measure protein, partial [Segnochrobactraceae bacterium EtOH-i3]